MKGLRRFLDKNVKPPFEEGGKLSKLYPLYDALDTFMFTPDHTTNRGAHIRDGIDLKRTMFMVIIALVPCLLFGMYNVGHQYYLGTGDVAAGDSWDTMFGDKFLYGLIRVLPLVVVSYAAGLAVEFAFCIIKRHAINEGFLVSGMLIPLIMPVDVPLWMVAVATIFAVLIGKEVFGGTGMNILNVALTARAFLFFAYPTKMSGNKVWRAQSGDVDTASGYVDGVSGATPLGDAAETIGMNQEYDKFLAQDKVGEAEAIKDQMAAKIDQLPDVAEAAIGLIPGSVGETSTIAILIGAALLLWTGIASFRVMFSMFLGGLAMGGIFNAFAVNPYMEIDPMHQLVMGGFMFGMVFMATDPVTAAQTNTGKIIYGFLAGFFAIMIRVFNPAYPEGVMMAILFMNVMAPTIDHYVIQANVKRRMKRAKALSSKKSSETEMASATA